MRVSSMNWSNAALCALLFGSTIVEATEGPSKLHPFLLENNPFKDKKPVKTPPSPHPRRHLTHLHGRRNMFKRDKGVCEFPKDEGLVAVTPNEMNGGWAMSPDMACEPGMFCPYACPPGKLMAQWDPKATEYTYPESEVS